MSGLVLVVIGIGVAYVTISIASPHAVVHYLNQLKRPVAQRMKLKKSVPERGMLGIPQERGLSQTDQLQDM